MQCFRMPKWLLSTPVQCFGAPQWFPTMLVQRFRVPKWLPRMIARCLWLWSAPVQRFIEFSCFLELPKPSAELNEYICIYTFPKQCSHCRGSGGDSGTGCLLRGQFGRLRRPTFVRRRDTSCMLPRSRADETLARVTFRRKASWFQDTLPLSPESGPGGSRMPQMPSEGSWVSLQSSLEVPPKPLLGSFFQDSSSRNPS